MLDLSTRAPATIARVEQQRYTALAQALHWITAALVLAVLPLAWIATSLPASPAKGFLLPDAQVGRDHDLRDRRPPHPVAGPAHRPARGLRAAGLGAPRPDQTTGCLLVFC